MKTAFKEWAVVVEALGHGDQCMILRKGGIREGRGGFQVEHTEFLLFPTLFHQQRQSVLPEIADRYNNVLPAETLESPTEAQEFTIRYLARVQEWHYVDSPETARRLQPYHVWKPEVIQERYDWGRSQGIYALIVRVSKLQQPKTLPMRPAYGGCKSWIDLEEDFDTAASLPVLSDDAFQTHRDAIRSCLATD